MRKSKQVMLSVVFYVAVTSCSSKKDEWTTGDNHGVLRDTSVHNQHYRYYGGGWYRVFNNRINTGAYEAAATSEIAQPGFIPKAAGGVRSGGFGKGASGAGGEGGSAGE